MLSDAIDTAAIRENDVVVALGRRRGSRRGARRFGRIPEEAAEVPQR
jgi:hypothetical protein